MMTNRDNPSGLVNIKSDEKVLALETDLVTLLSTHGILLSLFCLGVTSILRGSLPWVLWQSQL